MTIHEQEAEEVLGKWSSSRYAGLVGGYREGILNVWPSYYNLGSYWKRRDPYVVGDPFGMCYGEDGETIIVADGLEQKVYEMNRDGVRAWELDVSGYGTRPADVDYHPQNGRVVAAVMPSAILEVEDGTVVSNLTATELGGLDFGLYGGKLQYDPEDPSKFWLADTNNHVVFRSDFNGNVDKQFGTYGTSGHTDALLDRPVSVAVWRTGADLMVMIGDSYNNRLLSLDSAMTIDNRFPAPGVSCVAAGPIWGAIHPYGAESDNTPPVTYITTNPYSEWNPKYVLPFLTNKVCFHPTNPTTVLITRDWSLYELDLRAFKNPPIAPVKWRLEHGKTVGANETYSMTPFADWFFKMKTIHILSTQDATLYLDIARLTDYYGTWTAKEHWDEYPTSVSLTADTLANFSTENALGIIRPRVVMGGTEGDVYCWAEMTSQ